MDQGTATSLISGGSSLRRMSDLILELQRQTDGDRDVDSTLDELTGQAAQLVPGAAYAAITISRRSGEIDTLAATDRYPVVLDEIQRMFQEGPCVSGEPQHQIVRVDDLRTEERWPRYSLEAIAHTPIRALMSFRLFAHRPGAASLNLYSEQAHAFSEDSVTLGRVFAAYITLTWSMLRREQQFRKGLASRDIIGQAKGMLMERFQVDADTAFEWLRQRSQESNTPVATLAQRIAESRDEPCV